MSQHREEIYHVNFIGRTASVKGGHIVYGLISIELIAMIKKQYRLEWLEIHGILHWIRTFNNGIMLSEQSGVNGRVVQFFSIFHDACRCNENRDNNHGSKGADLAIKNRDHIPLNDDEMDLLITACSLHTNTLDHDDITVQVCFDSDRLDIGRINIYPDTDRLCTALAKNSETIELAYRNSIHNNAIPEHPFTVNNDLIAI